MDFYRYFESEELNYARAFGQSATRWFLADAFDSATRNQIAASGKSRGFCVAEIDCSTWYKVSDWKQICLSVLHQMKWQKPDGTFVVGFENIVFEAAVFSTATEVAERATIWNNQTWAMHEGVRTAVQHVLDHSLAKKQMREGEQAIIRLFLRGNKPAVNLLRANRLHAFRDPLSERNAEAFLWSIFAGVRALGLPGSLVLLRLGEDARALENRSAAYYQIKWQEGAFALRRWIDRCVSASALSCYFHLWCSEAMLDAFGDSYPAFRQRLDVLHRPPMPPYRTPIQTNRALDSSINPSDQDAIDELDGSEKQRHAVLMMNALRFGLVPSAQIEEMTLGIERLVDWVSTHGVIDPTRQEVIAQQLPTVSQPLVLVGSYGSGKSHFLQVIRQQMLKNNAIVSIIELDGRRCSWARAEGLLVELVHALSTTFTEIWESAWERHGEALQMKIMQTAFSRTFTFDYTVKEYIPFQRFWEGMVATMSFDRADRHRWQSRMLSIALKTGAEWRADELAEWQDYGVAFDLMKMKPWIDRLRSKRTASFVVAVKEIACLIAFAGYSSWSILIDELDYDTRIINEEPEVFEDARELMNAVQKNAGNIRFGLAVTPMFFENSGGLFDVYAQWIQQSQQTPFWIPNWTQSERIALAEKINQLYTAAYSKPVPNNQNLIVMFDRMMVKQSEVRMDQIRQFIKWYVHLLDVGYGPRDMQTVAATNKSSNSS